MSGAEITLMPVTLLESSIVIAFNQRFYFLQFLLFWMNFALITFQI